MTRNLAELDHRESNGISVTLLWNRTTRTVSVHVVDEGSNEDFTIESAPDEALTVFHHPFAFTATRPIRHRHHTVAG